MSCAQSSRADAENACKSNQILGALNLFLCLVQVKGFSNVLCIAMSISEGDLCIIDSSEQPVSLNASSANLLYPEQPMDDCEQLYSVNMQMTLLWHYFTALSLWSSLL